MGLATATIKYLVFIFNALCALIGIGTIVVSSLALKDAAHETRSIIIFFIVIGSVVFLISFFGCCGAIKENVCLTWTYAIVLLVLVILTSVLSFVYLQRFDSQQAATNTVNVLWTQQKNNTEAMTFLQTNLKCCGKTGPVDYTNEKLVIPVSCYQNGTSTGTSNSTLTGTSNSTIYHDGCISKLTIFYATSLHWVKLTSWILIGIESAAFLFATFLAISFVNEQRRSRY